MSNVYTVCENCNAQYPHEILTKCPGCGSQSVYWENEFDREKLIEKEEDEERTI